MNETLAQETRAIEQSALINLFIVDFTNILSAYGKEGSKLYLCNQLNEKEENIVYAGQVYLAAPLEATGFELKAKGTSSRPKLAISNEHNNVGKLCNEFGNLVGAKVTRIVTYGKFLDPVNFNSGTNEQADPQAHIKQEFVIERLTGLNKEVGSFELAVPVEADNAIFPSRIMISSVCHWQYRSEQCGYKGGACATEDNKPTDDKTKDKCSKTLKGCRMRFGKGNVLPFGGFPSMERR